MPHPLEPNVSYSEPNWTPAEIEKFWAVLELYLIDLLSNRTLPEHSIDFTDMDPKSSKDWTLCLEYLHECMWSGRYTETVANMKAVRLFFNKSKLRNIAVKGRSDLIDYLLQSISLKDELQTLKDIFFQRPISR